MKARLDKEKEQEQIGKEKKDQVGLGMITEYGSDDDDDDDINDGSGDVNSEGKMPSKVVGAAAVQGPLAKPSDSTTALEEAAKEARRKRAKEWAEKRREMKFKDDTIS